MFEDDDTPEQRNDRIKQLPVYKKSEEILTLVRSLLKGATSEDLEKHEDEDEETEEFLNEMFETNKEYMMSNALIIPAKIAGAEGADLYDLRMENATIIRKAARELLTDATGLQLTGFKDVEYLDLLRLEIDEFRVLFAEWVKTFDQGNYIIDRWGLFNPPGVAYDDHDPDDDIPFNPDDFLGDL